MNRMPSCEFWGFLFPIASRILRVGRVAGTGSEGNFGSFLLADFMERKPKRSMNHARENDWGERDREREEAIGRRKKHVEGIY